MNEKLALTQQLVKGLKAWEWRRIRDIIDRQYEQKANKLALDDLSCESIKKWFTGFPSSTVAFAALRLTQVPQRHA